MSGGFIFFGVVALALVVISVVRNSSANDAWAQVGSKLGLAYKQDGRFGKRRLSGKLDGFRVSVQTERVRRGKNRKTCTRYEVHYASLDLGLELGRESSLSVLGRFFGKQDLEIGDRHFDREVRISAKSRTKLIAFLTPLRKTVILRTLGRYGHCVISDARIENRERGLALDARKMVLVLRNLVELAQALAGTMIEEEAHEVVLPPVLLPAEYDGSSEELEPAVYEELFPLTLEPESSEWIEVPEELVEHVDHLEPISEPAHAPEPEPLPEPVCETEPEPVSPGDPEPGLTVEALLEELFAENQMANVTAEVFERRFLDRQVRGSGRLHRVEHYYSDRFFGSQPGVRATVIVREHSTAAFGVRAVQAVLQLDEEEETRLQDRIDETVVFHGRVVHCDPYLRTLVIAEARAR